MTSANNTIIAVSGFPPKFTLNDVVIKLAKFIRGNFTALNFARHTDEKTCYLELSEGVDPVKVLQRLRKVNIQQFQLNAYIPDTIPNLKISKKPKTVPKKLRHKLGIPADDDSSQTLDRTCNELMTEFEHKFPGLFELDKKMKNQLTEEMRKIIHQRLQVLMNVDPINKHSSFKLSLAYRKKHPHDGDFQFIVRTLHNIQDVMGVPRTKLDESQLSAIIVQSRVCLDLPHDDIRVLIQKYCNLASNKVVEHIDNLDARSLDTDTEETITRKRVRHELKTMAPFVTLIVRDILENKFLPLTKRLRKIRVYGEPFLPNRQAMLPFFKKHEALQIRRSKILFNLVLFSVVEKNLQNLLADDGTEIGGAKLVIRPLSNSEKRRLREFKKMGAKYPMSDSETDDTDDESTTEFDDNE